MPRRPSSVSATLHTRMRRAAAAAIALGLALASGLVATSAAAAEPVFTVSGTVAAESRADVDVYALVWDDESGESEAEWWAAEASSPHVNAKTGAFSLKLPADGSHYTLYFATYDVPFLDTYLGGSAKEPVNGDLSAAVFTGKKGSALKVGEVSLVPAGVIEGVVTGADHKPLFDADVWATSADADDDSGSDGWMDETVYTNRDGSYYLRVARDDAYIVSVYDYESGSEAEYGAVGDGDGTPVDVTAANDYHASGIDVEIPLPGATVVGWFAGDGVDDNDAAKLDNIDTVDTYIYKDSAGPSSAVPYTSAELYDGYFAYSDLGTGRYTIAFRDHTTHEWLAWKDYEGENGTAGADAGSSPCALPLTVARGDNVELGLITIDHTPATACAAPWGDDAGTFSGSVTNMPAKADVTATLYYADDDESLVPIDVAPVSSSGDYSINAITDAGRYLVFFSTGELTPLMDGGPRGFNPNVDEYEDHEDQLAIVKSTPVVTAGDDSANNDISLAPAALLTGHVLADGKALEGTQVGAFDIADELAAAAVVDAHADGSYVLKVALNSRYVLAAASELFATQYFDHVAAVADATKLSITAPGLDARDFDFDLKPLPASIIGLVIDIHKNEVVPTAESLKATLYRKSGVQWKKVDTTASDPVLGAFGMFQFDASTGTPLTGGDYRVKLTSGKRWLPIDSYVALDANGEGEEVAGRRCYLPIDDLGAHEQRAIYVLIDSKSTAHDCGRRPATATTTVTTAVGAYAGASAGLLPEIVATSTPKPHRMPTATPTPSATSTAAPSASGDNNGVDAPAAQDDEVLAQFGLPTWAIIGIGAIVVVIVLGAAAAGTVVRIRRRP